MAKKVSAVPNPTKSSNGNSSATASGITASELQRPAAEILYAEELGRLEKATAALPKPPGWKMPPQAVLDFVLGNEAIGIGPKFVGRRSFMERCVVSLRPIED